MKQIGISALDHATGGLCDSGAYLLSGAQGTGKSSVCLNFLERGLEAGETAVMITSRPPSQVIQHSRALGCDLSAYAAMRALQIFEYPDNIASIVSRVENHRQLSLDLANLMGGRPVDRLVVDTAMPLVMVNGRPDAQRLRSLLEAFSPVDQCAIYVVDDAPTPFLASCRDIVSGSIWLQGQQMTVEGFGAAQPRTIAFESGHDSARSPRDSRPSVLVIESDPGRRMHLCSQLERAFAVSEARNSASAVNQARAIQPHAIVMAAEFPGASARQFAAMLREAAPKALVAGLTDCFSSPMEQISALAGGIDVCLPYGGDGRVLRLCLMKLLERIGTAGTSDSSAETGRVARPQSQDAFSYTSDYKTFCARIAREALYARENSVPFLLLAFRMNDQPGVIDELATTVTSQLEAPAAVYCGPSGVACLLPETDSSAAFLAKFWNRWNRTVHPSVEEIRYSDRDAFLHKAREFVKVRVSIKPGGAMRAQPVPMPAPPLRAVAV